MNREPHDATAHVRLLSAVRRFAPPLWFERNGADPDAVVGRLASFARAIEKDNRRFGLVAKEEVEDFGRLIDRHIVDSLTVWRVLFEVAEHTGRRRLYDFGSGAGLPGVPLAIAFGDYLTETVLVERRAKRTAFLLGATVGIPRVRVAEIDAEQIASAEGRERLLEAIVTFRAYRPTSGPFLRTLGLSLPSGTPVIAMKGTDERTEAEREIVSASPYAADAGTVPIRWNDGSVERNVLRWTTVNSDR